MMPAVRCFARALFRHSPQGERFRFGALLDKGRTRRNKGTRQKPARDVRIHEEWTNREDTELELRGPVFGSSASGERHEGR